MFPSWCWLGDPVGWSVPVGEAILDFFLNLFADSSYCVASTFHRSMGLAMSLDWQTLPSSKSRTVESTLS